MSYKISQTTISNFITFYLGSGAFYFNVDDSSNFDIKTSFIFENNTVTDLK